MSVLDAVLSSFTAFDGSTTDSTFLPMEFGGRKTQSGERVSPDRALSLSAYFACIRVISEDIGKLPFPVYKRLPNGGKERYIDHPVYRLLHDRPNPESSPISFRETLTSFCLGWGNGYAEIERSQRGDPIALWHIHSVRVVPKRAMGDNSEGLQLKKNALYYEIRTDDIGVPPVGLLPENMLHIHGLGPDGVTGWSVCRFASESIGLGLAAERYGGAFFGNSATPSGILKTPGKLDDPARKNLRESWSKNYGGANAKKTAILEQGMEWQSISIPPNESQFIETRQFSVEEICRWFRVAPSKIQHLIRATYNNIEHQNISHVVDTLMPWFVRWEQEAWYKLLKSDPNVFAEHIVNGLLRGDSKSRAEFYRQMFAVGALSINDMRSKENMNPIGPEGDVYYVPSNMTPANIAMTGVVSSGKSQSSGRSSSRGNSADAVLPVLEDACQRESRRIATATRNCGNKYERDKNLSAFRNSMNKFFAEEKDRLFQALLPGASAHAQLSGVPFSAPALAAWCSDFCEAWHDKLSDDSDYDGYCKAVSEAFETIFSQVRQFLNIKENKDATAA